MPPRLGGFDRSNRAFNAAVGSAHWYLTFWCLEGRWEGGQGSGWGMVEWGSEGSSAGPASSNSSRLRLRVEVVLEFSFAAILLQYYILLYCSTRGIRGVGC